ncbi:MAG: methyltransferase domain-containing protein [Chloroflexota bacterium]|nr:methyltransferase domain-containing protein [Chloroflexota bacterium]
MPSKSAPPWRSLPDQPSSDGARASWAETLDLASAAWRPETEALIERLRLRPGASILDAGCGTATVTAWLADRVGRSGSTVGLDIDFGALEWAAWALQQQPGDRRIDLWHGDLLALPFPDDTFDAAWCSSVLGYVADPRRALSELVRVVRPSGKVVAVSGDAARHTFLPIAPDLERRLHEVRQRAAAGGAWGEPIDLHLGRRLYPLARGLAVAKVQALAIVWERTAPLSETEQRYLARTTDWLIDPEHRHWVGDDWQECRRLFDPESGESILSGPDLHVLQTVSAVVITV